jgi:hypothetical protein
MTRSAILLRLFGGLAAAAGAGVGDAAAAGERPPTWLVFGGLSAGADYAASYKGAIVAPSGDLWRRGVRLRPAFTAGFYGIGSEEARRTVGFASSALLAGYQIAAGDVTLAVYGGAEAVYFARSDPPHFRAGWHLGAKAIVEAGVALDERTRLDGHVAYSTPLRRLETGAKMLRRIGGGPWQIGPAAAYFHKPDGRDLRLGLALARRTARSGLSVSAGISLDRDSSAGSYLTIGFDQSF